MKRIAVLILIPLILTGCGSKETVDVKALSSAIVPYEPLTEKFMDVAEYPKEARNNISKTTEIHVQAKRDFLSDTLSREFSPEELDKLSQIFSSELVARVQQILASEECLIGMVELSKPELKKLEQKSGKEGCLAPPPHTTKQAGPHLAVRKAPTDD